MSQDMLGLIVKKLVTMPSEVLGIIYDLLEKLTNPEWVEATKKFLRKENPWQIGPFKIWKTVKLGTMKDADEFRKAIKALGYKIGDLGNDILGKPAFRVSKTKVKVDLVNVSVAELGFKDGAKLSDIYKKALGLGLQLCPNEVGPQLRLQCRDQPIDGVNWMHRWIYVAMKPIARSGHPLIFLVERTSDGCWLEGYDGDPDHFWKRQECFVFVLPRK